MSNQPPTAVRVRDRLREGLRDLSARFAEENRTYRGLGANIYVLYAIECFLQALAATESGRHFVLKGGNLFRVWDGMASFRPTGDVDMQRLSSARDFSEVTDLRREVEEIVGTSEFQRATGLYFPLESFKLEPIRKGLLIAYRLEGKAFLGEPHLTASKPAEVPFCLEVTYGLPPEGAVEVSKWESVMSNGGSFALMTSKPEWMASEKFHSIVTRGSANSRLKDFRDLAVLLRDPAFDGPLMSRCIVQVFEELGHTHLVPAELSGIATLSTGFASSQNEYLWQARRWPEWEGRDWVDGRDPSLSETVSEIGFNLGSLGVLIPGPGHAAAAQLGMLLRASAELDEKGVTPILAGRFATALKGVYAAVKDVAPADIAWRWHGAAALYGAQGESPETVLKGALMTAEDLGILAAIDRGWDRGRGGGIAALRELAALLRTAVPATRSRSVECPVHTNGEHTQPNAAVETGRKQAGTGRVRRGPSGGAPQKTPDELMAEGVNLIFEGRPGTHVWFGGLAKILGSSGARVPDVAGAMIEMPTDARAPYIWLQIAKRQGVEPDLARAVEMARETLGMVELAPSMGR